MPSERFLESLSLYDRAPSGEADEVTRKQVSEYFRLTKEEGFAWGVIRGLGLTIWRILRCNPFCRSGIDYVPKRKPRMMTAGKINYRGRRGKVDSEDSSRLNPERKPSHGEG